MSATNTTTNYNLPIFVSSDKPAWLVDFNGAMNAIDAQMKVNADAIAAKSPILTFSDTTDIDFTVTGTTVEASLDNGVAGTISRAFTKPVSSPATAQIPSVDTSNNQQLLDIGSGLKVDSGALTAIDLDLTDITTYAANDLTSSTSGITIASASITVALNSAKTVGKIYGSIQLNSTLSSRTSTTITIPKSVAATGAAYSIFPAGIAWKDLAQANYGNNGSIEILVSASGALSLAFSAHANTKTLAALWPCLYFFKNFGDVPTP